MTLASTREAPLDLPEIRTLTDEELKARKGRNVVLALALFVFVALVFVITIVRLYSNTHGHH